MTCDHEGDGCLPAFLCRKCHPELNLTQKERAVLDEADRKARAKRSAAEQKARDLHRAQMRLVSLTSRGEPAKGSVSAKIAESTRRKIAKLSA